MTCPHGYPKPASCWECMQDGAVSEPARWRREGSPFRAGYDGVCPACGKAILVGTMLQRWDLGDERTAYTHAGCGAPR